jgi:hypothetical protein
MTSPFGLWLQRMWVEHVDEVREWTGRAPEYTAADYFGKYKWWLRTVYRNRG